MAKLGRRAHDDVLTQAEWRVCEAVRHGLTNPEIARRQGISTHAVKYHVGNVLQKLGFSSRKEIQRWDGVRKSSALIGRANEMAATFTLGPIGQISRTVLDCQAAEHWYREVLGLEHMYTFGKLAFFNCGGIRLFLSESESSNPESIIYFRVQDIHSVCQALKRRGVEFITAPHLVHKHADGVEEWMAFLNDNEGRPLAIMEIAPPEEPVAK